MGCLFWGVQMDSLIADSNRGPGIVRFEQEVTMAGRSKLTDEQISERLASVPQWSKTGDSITRTYEAPSFLEGIAFVQNVAEIAEAKDHHPDIDIRYNRVTLTLSTHDQGGLTGWDFDVAEAVDAL